MRYYEVNVERMADGSANLGRTGQFFFHLKNMAVRANHTVLGSGDGNTRFAWSGVTAALPQNERGLGGDYDCWITGDSRTTSTVQQPGDASNANAWCVLQAPSGRQILLCESSSGNAGWQGYGRVAILRQDLGSWDGSTAAAATIPALVTGEYWRIGARASPTGAILLNGNAVGRYHFWADDAPGSGGDGCFGGIMTLNNASDPSLIAFLPVAAGEEWAGDPDPCVYPHTSSGFPTTNAYNVVTDTWVGIVDPGFGGLWGSSNIQRADQQASTVLQRWVPAFSNNPVKGKLHPGALRWGGIHRGVVLLDSRGETWLSAGAYSIPWPTGVRPRL